MKVSGFTFIRNAQKYDYPIVEAIQSILPLCDEVVVAVGNSDDNTLELVRSIDPKVRIIETVWDDSLRTGGRVLAVETDKAFAAISSDTDWAFYIQGDEVIHEKYLDTIRAGMEQHLSNKKVDGLLFHYEHFYGSYDYVGTSSSWYRNEIRVIRNNPSIYAYRDAQGFRKGNNEKLRVKRVEAYVYHYGWVKPPEVMQRKQEDFPKLWFDDEWVKQNVEVVPEFSYEKHVKSLGPFKGTHPKVMQPRVNASNWTFQFDPSFQKKSMKDKLKRLAWVLLRWDINYRNYKLLP
ncbi:MAG: hypothetical protein JXR65_05100 [Bacteroidales bacterium]|nr:hypothetical protein [Bacteroidales bacterium]